MLCPLPYEIREIQLKKVITREKLISVSDFSRHYMAVFLI
jgi:hypothetical protein